MKKPTLALITLCAASALLCAIVVFNAIEGSTGLPKIGNTTAIATLDTQSSLLLEWTGRAYDVPDTSGVIWMYDHSHILANGD